MTDEQQLKDPQELQDSSMMDMCHPGNCETFFARSEASTAEQDIEYRVS